jgi:hypothetical protein
MELSTNRVSGTDGKTGLWYGLDRDINNWEYYGNYARSISDVYDRTITYGDETIQNLCLFEIDNPSPTKIDNAISNLYKKITENGQLNLCFKSENDLIINKSSYDFTLEAVKKLVVNYEIFNNVNFNEYINAEYISQNEIGTIIKIIK